jgi:hypothetical protein
MKVALVLSLSIIIGSINGNRIPALKTDNDSKVTKFISKLINESNQKLAGIQDVAILDGAEGWWRTQ